MNSSSSSVSIEIVNSNQIENNFPMEVASEIEIYADKHMESRIENNNNSVANSKIKHDIHSSAAKMISTLRVSSSITGTTLKQVMTAIEMFISDISDFVQDKVTDFCISKDIDIKNPEVMHF